MTAYQPRDDAPVILTSRGSRRTGFIVMTLVATFWSGISGFMWYLALRDGEWVAVAFLSLFVLVGVGMCAAAVYQFLALFNPHVHLTLPAEPLALGGPVTIEWELVGNAARLRDFSIQCVGTELATYRQGTSTRTDRNVFREIDPLKLDDPARIMDARGRCHFVLPADTMHSFKSRNNEVRWSLRAQGTIHRWPDVNDEWTIEVQPLPAWQTAAGGNEEPSEGEA